jgi:hypothetical protein
MHDEVISVWDTACSIDPTLSLRRKDLPALLKKNVRATPYSRARLFSQMAEGEVSLFANLSVPVRGNSPANKLSRVIKGLNNSFPPSTRTEVQAGPSWRRYRVSVPELVPSSPVPSAVVLDREAIVIGSLSKVYGLAGLRVLVGGSERVHSRVHTFALLHDAGPAEYRSATGSNCRGAAGVNSD